MVASVRRMKWYQTTGGLGGVITATELLSQNMTLSSAITGVTVLDGADNALGIGALRFDARTMSFFYTPPGGVEGLGVVVSTTDEYMIRGSGSMAGYIRLSITFGSLPVTSQTRTVTVTSVTGGVFGDVTKANALAGLISYRCIYLKNTHPTDQLYGSAIWINADSVGGDYISLGLDPAGVGGTAATIANDTISPVGVTFTTPLSESTALTTGAVLAGQAFALWIRRTVPALTSPAYADDYSWLNYRILA